MRAVHADCPRCGAAIMLEGDRRISRCEYCNSKVLVEVQGAIPMYWLRPVLERESAKRTVFKALGDPMMPSDIKKKAAPENFSIAFIPFYIFRGRRVGLLTIKEAAEPPAGASWAFVNEAPAVDSRVLYNAFSASGVATDLPGWGIDKISVDSALDSELASPEVYSAAELQKMGEVYEVTRSLERFVSEKTRMAETKEISVRLRILPEDVSVCYYPVWLARYTYRGMIYKATVDAITGTLLMLRAPQSDRLRLPVMLAILAVLAWPVSKLVAYIARSSRPGVYATAIGYLIMAAWPFTMTVFFGVLLVLYLSWMNYRYPGELVITPEGRVVEKVGRPAETWVERMFEKLDEIVQRQLREMARRRGMWDG